MEESHRMDYVDNSLGNNNGRVRTSHKIIIDDSRIMNDKHDNNNTIHYIITIIITM